MVLLLCLRLLELLFEWDPSPSFFEPVALDWDASLPLGVFDWDVSLLVLALDLAASPPVAALDEDALPGFDGSVFLPDPDEDVFSVGNDVVKSDVNDSEFAAAAAAVATLDADLLFLALLTWPEFNRSRLGISAWLSETDSLLDTRGNALVDRLLPILPLVAFLSSLLLLLFEFLCCEPEDLLLKVRRRVTVLFGDLELSFLGDQDV